MAAGPEPLSGMAASQGALLAAVQLHPDCTVRLKLPLAPDPAMVALLGDSEKLQVNPDCTTVNV
jgi:hypothetical protein